MAYRVTSSLYFLFVAAAIITMIVAPFVSDTPQQIGDAMRAAFALLGCATFVLLASSSYCDQHDV